MLRRFNPLLSRGLVRRSTTAAAAAAAGSSVFSTAAPLSFAPATQVFAQRFCSTDKSGEEKKPAETTAEGEGEKKKMPIRVHWSMTPNPDSYRFYSLELSFLPPGSSLDFPNEGHAYKSPLASALFSTVPGVVAVFIADEYVTVTKESSADWDDLSVHVRNAIVEFAHSGVNILSEEGESELETGHPDTEPQPGDDETVLAIKELLHTRIRPMLAGDGGGLRFVAFEDGLVYLILTGACRSCPSSGNTLKNGIERMLAHWIPEVAEVVEVDTDWELDYNAVKKEEQERLEKMTPEERKEEEDKAMRAMGDAHVA